MEAMTVRRISFARYGGFAPQYVACELNLESFAPDEAAALRALIEASGILRMTSLRIPKACDIVTYRFDFETDRGKHTVLFDGPTVPQSVGPLVAYLLARSRDVLQDVT